MCCFFSSASNESRHLTPDSRAYGVFATRQADKKPGRILGLDFVDLSLFVTGKGARKVLSL